MSTYADIYLLFPATKPPSAVKLFDKKMSRAIKESKYLTKAYKPKSTEPKKVCVFYNNDKISNSLN